MFNFQMLVFRKLAFLFTKNSNLPSFISSALAWRYGDDPDAHRCEVSCYGEGHSNDAPFRSWICCLTHLGKRMLWNTERVWGGGVVTLCFFTCPSNAATLAVLTMQPRCPSASGSFFDISPTARRITLKVPAMFTCRRHAVGGHIWFRLSSSTVSPSHVDDPLEVLQAVGDVLLEVVGFNSDCDAGTVHCQVQFTKLLSSQRHRRLHVCLWGHL